MKRLMREELGRQLPLGDIATRNHDPGNDGIIGSVGLNELEPAPRPLRVSRADIPLAARAWHLQNLQEIGGDVGDVVGVHEVEADLVDELAPVVPEHPFRRFVHIQDPARLVDDGNELVGQFNEPPEAVRCEFHTTVSAGRHRRWRRGDLAGVRPRSRCRPDAA